MLVLIALAVGGFLWWRSKRPARRGLSLSPTTEEHIPLRSAADDDDAEGAGAFGPRHGKGKGRELPEEEAIFEVGDDDELRTPMTGQHS